MERLIETEGSYVFVLDKRANSFKIKHGRTLNKAKEKGLKYIKDKDEEFFRFTKIPFPYLLYVSKSYVVYVVYARLAKEDIPYTVKFSMYDDAVLKDIESFCKASGKDMYYDPSKAIKSRRMTIKDKQRATRRRLYRDKRGF